MVSDQSEFNFGQSEFNFGHKTPNQGGVIELDYFPAESLYVIFKVPTFVMALFLCCGKKFKITE